MWVVLSMIEKICLCVLGWKSEDSSINIFLLLCTKNTFYALWNDICCQNWMFVKSNVWKIECFDFRILFCCGCVVCSSLIFSDYILFIIGWKMNINSRKRRFISAAESERNVQEFLESLRSFGGSNCIIFVK